MKVGGDVMSKKFVLDSSSIDSDLEKDAESFSIKDTVGHSKLPDISDIQKLFNKNNETRKNIPENNKRSDKSSSDLPSTVSKEIESEEDQTNQSIENSPKGREVILFLDQVLCDPRDNISRGCRIYHPNDHEVTSLAHLIRTKGLINPVEVSELDEPIEITNPGPYAKFYTHKVVSGFKRFAALRYLGFNSYRFTLFYDLSDDDKLIHNGIENWGRSDPTDYDLALYIAVLHRKRNWSPQRIALEIGGKVGRVESLLLIATKLPKELLEVFRIQPTPEIRRDLAKISLIERDTIEETHKAMMAEWIRIENERKKTEDIRSINNNPVSNNRNSSIDRNRNKHTQSLRVNELRNEQVNAKHWFDSLTNTYKPITEEMREYGDMILRHVSDRKLRSPFR